MQTQEKKSQAAMSRSNKASLSGGPTWPSLILFTAILVGIVIYTDFWKTILLPATKEEFIDPKDYHSRAKRVLRSTPLIDGHNDFPFLLRQQLQSKIYDHNFEDEKLASHTDFQKMKDGMMGGQFWSVYVPCPEALVPGVDLHDSHRHIPDFNEPNVCMLFITLFLRSRKNNVLTHIDVNVFDSGLYEILLNKSTSPNASSPNILRSSNSVPTPHVCAMPTKRAKLLA